MSSVTSPAGSPLVEPGQESGLRAVFHRRYLLRLLVRRELKARYKGSLLGLGWSYVRPAVHFAVYFFVIGIFLGMDQLIESFPIYLFSGMVLINLFTETLHSATRSITGNAPVIRKVFLPRELFPVASLLVSLVHFVPGMAILLAAAATVGWTPSPAGIGALALGLTIIVVLGMGLGLMCAAVNVTFRDLEQVVDIMMIVITWSVPMIYPWTHVRDNAPGWVLDVYLANPLVAAVSLFQDALWRPGISGPFAFPPHMYGRAAVALGVAVLLLVIGRWVFGRRQQRFAQEL